MGLEAGRGGAEEKEEEEMEKTPHMCESIGHQPLWGRCPAPSLNFKYYLLRQHTGTTDHLVLLQLFITAPAHPHMTWVGGKNKGIMLLFSKEASSLEDYCSLTN